MILATSALFYIAILAACQMLGAQVPDVLLSWLPILLNADGEAAYDAASVALLVDCVCLGLLIYVVGRRLTRLVVQ